MYKQKLNPGLNIMRGNIITTKRILSGLSVWMCAILLFSCIGPVPEASAQPPLSLPGLTINVNTSGAESGYGGIVNFEADTGLSAADEGLMQLRYIWTVRGSRNQKGFMGKYGWLDLAPDSYSVTLIVKDKYNGTYSTTTGFEVPNSIGSGDNEYDNNDGYYNNNRYYNNGYNGNRYNNGYYNGYGNDYNYNNGNNNYNSRYNNNRNNNNRNNYNRYGSY